MKTEHVKGVCIETHTARPTAEQMYAELLEWLAGAVQRGASTMAMRGALAGILDVVEVEWRMTAEDGIRRCQNDPESRGDNK